VKIAFYHLFLRAFFRSFSSSSNCLISEALTDEAAQQFVGTSLIIHSIGYTVIVPEVIFSEVAV